MADRKPTVYLKGSARSFRFSNGNEKIDFDINVDDLIEKYKEAGVEPNKGFYKLTIQPKREKDKYGNTHSVTVNTFVPDKSKAKPKADDSGSESPDSLPF